MKTNRKTPELVVNKMWNYVQTHVVETNKTKFTLLEPSAGSGDLLAHPLNYKYIIDCVELNEEKCNILKEKNYNTTRADFLKFETEKKYDVILAAPPFKFNIDVEHIEKMYSHLVDDGIIVTLTSPFWMTNSDPHQIKFRNWLTTKEHTMEMLPSMTFYENNRTVHTCILIIKK